ncbi:DUF4393 domain-containing protein [Streptococcus dysgalactiae]|uniref:DUF4393 domain-containing protein n=1 Tax=Streptococcus dysgalactiae TaxID=1334 RepID=UPI001FAA844A|nr:DUF4393 domain-containing protein [Streptococcus dysgalactiae]
MIDFSDIETYWPAASGALSVFITQGGLKPIFTSLNYKWYAKYGYKFEQEAKLKEINNEYVYEVKRKELENIQNFKNDIDTELAKIPSEKVVTPTEYVLNPALSEAEHFITDDSLRKMFAKLIASSFHYDKQKLLHSTFVQIIKELSPLDAQNLTILKDGNKPIVSLKLKGTLKQLDMIGYIREVNNLFLENKEFNNKIIHSSLINLQRLGLIEIDYSTKLLSINDLVYKKFQETEEYKEIENLMTDINNNKNADIVPNGILMDKGVVSLTEFGKNFTSICLE